jgi:hypothetical protein
MVYCSIDCSWIPKNSRPDTLRSVLGDNFSSRRLFSMGRRAEKSGETQESDDKKKFLR